MKDSREGGNAATTLRKHCAPVSRKSPDIWTLELESANSVTGRYKVSSRFFVPLVCPCNEWVYQRMRTLFLFLGLVSLLISVECTSAPELPTVSPEMDTLTPVPKTRAVATDTLSLEPKLTPTSTRAISQSSQNWHIDLALSGGFAGYQRTLDLASSGELTVTNHRISKQITARAPQKDLEEITALVDKAQSYQPTKPMQTCSDCFLYTLDIRRDGQTLSVRVDDSVLVESGFEPLMSILTRLMDQALSGKLKS